MKVKSFSIRIDEDLLYKLRYIAEYDGRSANSQLLHYVKKAVVEFERDVEPIPAPPAHQKEH